MHPAWMQNDEPPRREMSTSRPVAAPAPPRDSLLRSLFGMSPPNEVTRMHHSDSFGNMSFIGGEEEAHDAWHDKWEAHRRISVDNQEKERAAIAMVAGINSDVIKKTTTGLAAPGEVYKRAASLDHSASAAAFGVDAATFNLAGSHHQARTPRAGTASTTATTTAAVSSRAADDPWRSVFHPGRNYNVRGKNNIDKPASGDSKSVMDHHIAAENSGKNVKYHDAMKSALYEGRVE